MQKVKLYWTFFKSTLILNLGSSVLLSFVILSGLQLIMKFPPPFTVVYINCFMFGAPILCFYHKELARKNEYYFYYNKGITKKGLLIITWLMYILIGIVVLNILPYAKLT